MPVTNQSVGKDLSFTISIGGAVLALSGVTDYSAKKKNSMLTSKRLTGKMIHGVIADGWEISIRLDRKDATLDKFFANVDANYYAGINIPAGTIYETIQEVDGSVSQFRYTEVALQYDGGGDWKGDSYVSLTLTAYATERQLVN